MAVRIDNVSATTTAADATLTGVTDYVLVTNVGGGGKVYFRVDGVTAVAAADENHALPAVGGASKKVSVPRKGGTTTVSVVASAATEVTVEAVDF